MNSWRKSFVSQLLSRDGVIAYPTEGVWGLGCLPDSSEGVARILTLKNRPWQQGLLLVAAEMSQFEGYLKGLDAEYRKVLEETWPGPVTFLVPDNGTAPGWIVGSHTTVGLRVSDHPLVQALCTSVGPLVSTSANISSRPAARTTFGVRRYFGNRIDLVVPGELGQTGRASEIRDLVSGEVLR
ncbi:MAG: tRNA threonylcarbamoyladenosine biosynthesis protein RimN [Gammaproteobacteria bacterium]|nr:tRNA threonylcarbamoyladenosine biosynthesis protein RimN [Gammaproteobacteria bacterium]MBT7371758.1 tRNA threonylcarbamoyladenosine biosynthesis protein RimN [Gammaproteobacteria bacterium]